MDLKKLGQRIKSQREKRRLRQTDIASALQISTQAVSKWERGENAPDISVLMELSNLLGVSIEWLLGGTTAERDTFCATIFCTSMNGYAKKASLVMPKELAFWINGIHYTVTEVVKSFDGVPIKYVGDGFLSFFSGTNHHKRALEAARQAKSLLNMAEFIILLHKGDIFLGTIGHPDYARPDIMGETVNTAFLAMQWVSQNCKNGIGITEMLVKEFDMDEEFVPCGKTPIQGSSEMMIYEPKKFCLLNSE